MNLANIYFQVVPPLVSLGVAMIGVVVFIGDRKSKITLLWFLSCLFASLWSISFFFVINAPSKGVSEILIAILHGSAVLVLHFWLRFILNFLDVNNKLLLRYASVGTVVMLALNISPWFIKDMVAISVFEYYVVPDWGYYIFSLYFTTVAITGLTLLTKTVHTASGIRSNQIKSIFVGSIMGFIGGGSTFLLSFGIPFPPYLFILFAGFPLIIGRGIVRYKLFNIKVIATELLTLGIWVFLSVRLMFSETTQDTVINASLLGVVIVFGIMLVKSVSREVSQREKIQKLATDLEQANGRLKELDVMKTEFMSFATHQIRGPLTAIKGYASLLIEGDYGPIASEIKDPIDKIFQSSNSLAVLVEDYLNVSRIEQGRMKYEFTAFDLGKLVAQTADELKPNIEKKGLKLNLDVDGEMPVFGDAGKIKQVISNVIDNSAKYTERGEISVSIKANQDKKKALITVKDTGVGIDPAVMPKLFQKFSRAMDASKANILGTGLGLYVARQLI